VARRSSGSPVGAPVAVEEPHVIARQPAKIGARFSVTASEKVAAVAVSIVAACGDAVTKLNLS